MKNTIIGLALAATFAFAEAPQNDLQKEFSPTLDVDFSPYSGAANLMFLHQGFEKLEDWIFPPAILTKEDFQHPDQCPSMSRLSKLSRQARHLLFWLPEACSLIITQHEVFGHGYRIRDIGSDYCKVDGYQMHVIGGATSYATTALLTPSQNLCIAIAGMEANTILANQTRLKWLSNGMIDPRQFLVYNMSSLDMMFYTFSVHHTPNNSPHRGNDVAQYLYYLNATYPDSHLGCHSLRNQSLVNLLDPFIFYSIYTASTYQTLGVPASRTPMIPIGSVKYLPAVRYALTPFGGQYYLENFILKGNSPTYFYLKWGQHGANTYYGLGFENRNVFAWENGAIGFRMHLWRQPNVLFQPGALSVEQMMELPKGAVIPRLYPESVLTEKHFGAAVSMVGAYGIANSPAQLNLELGYKTKGYLPGEALREAPIVRGGFSLSF